MLVFDVIVTESIPSTMVIAGVLFAVLINPTLLMVIDSFTSIYPIIFNIPLFTML